MTNKQSGVLYYWLKRLVGRILVGLYILWVSGVFSTGITQTGVKFIPALVIGIILSTFIKDYYDHIMSDKDPKPKQKAIAKALLGMTPWIIAIIIGLAIKMGIANMFEHLVIIGALEILANGLHGLEIYYKALPEVEVVE